MWYVCVYVYNEILHFRCTHWLTLPHTSVTLPTSALPAHNHYLFIAQTFVLPISITTSITLSIITKSMTSLFLSLSPLPKGPHTPESSSYLLFCSRSGARHYNSRTMFFLITRKMIVLVGSRCFHNRKIHMVIDILSASSN